MNQLYFKTSPCRVFIGLFLSAILAFTMLPLIPSAAASAFAEEDQTDSHSSDASAATASDEQRVIKVGYMQSEGSFVRNEDGTFEGYTYDYLVRVAQFTDWTYEFVEAPGTNDNERASNLVEMLLNGEVDIEGNMTYSPSLAKQLAYPQNSYGTAHTSLLVPNASALITQTDLFTRDELRVAILSSANKRREELVYFCEQNSINLTMIDCADLEELYEKVSSGEADAALDIDVNVHDGFHIVATFAGRPYFFAASKDQTDIIDELNTTIAYINKSDPTLQNVLYDKYFMSSKSDYTLTEEELQFAREHETLRVGVLAQKAPVQSFDRTTGAFEGVSKGLLDYIAKHTGLSYEVVSIAQTDDLAAAIHDADVDIIAGVDNDYEAAAALGYSLSAPYMTASELLVYNKFVDPDNLENKKLAVPWELSTTVRDNPNAVVYESIEACLEAVNNGAADYTYGSSYSTPYYLSVNDLKNLLTLPISSSPLETCLGVVQPIEAELLLIIDKSIRGLSSAELDSIVYDNSLIDHEEQVGLLLRDHLPEVAVACISLLVLIIFLLALYLRTRMRAAQNVRAENQRFQKLYSLANEQFFEYSIKTDSLLVSNPSSTHEHVAVEKSGASDDKEQPYRVVHNARERLLEAMGPEFADAFTSPCNKVTDALYAPENGSRQWLRIMSHFVTDDMGKPITVIGKITDIDDEVREKNDLSQRAHHDGLTGLLNWKTFQERVEDLLKKGEAGALLIIDTDDFKLVNDSYGHLSGDVALQCTAQALESAFRPQDLVGRLGGDEFAVCVSGNISTEQLSKRCTGIIENAVAFSDQDGKERSVTVSIGGVKLPHGEPASYEAAYQQADNALYRAKADGKHRFCIDPFQAE